MLDSYCSFQAPITLLAASSIKSKKIAFFTLNDPQSGTRRSKGLGEIIAGSAVPRSHLLLQLLSEEERLHRRCGMGGAALCTSRCP